jgi:predicted acylesterase/phospholipase RssA
VGDFKEMSITIVQKSNLKKVRKGAVKALVLAGGAVTGGAFEAGGVKALNDYFTNFKITDFDIFVGVSSGSLIAAPLVAGLSPESILRSFYGSSRRFSRLKRRHYYKLNLVDWITSPLSYLSKVMASSLLYLKKGELELPPILSMLPSGVFDNSPLEEYFRKNIERNHLTNDFALTKRLTGKSLYICATTLDNAKRVVFGPDEKNDVSISRAIQASTAMPGFYKPARIDGVDYVDGGVRETAHIDIAVKKGAQLIVCYNPFRPFDPSEIEKYLKQKKSKSENQDRIAERGMGAVILQMVRAFFYTRLHVTLDHFRNDPNFKGDIILIEPRADDVAFYGLNPIYLSNRVDATRLGFESVRNSIDQQFDEVAKIFAAYGIKMSKEGVEEEFEKLIDPDVGEEEIRAVLETKKEKRERLERQEKQARREKRERQARQER